MCTIDSRNVASILFDRICSSSATPKSSAALTPKVHEVADYLMDVLDSIVKSNGFSVETEVCLDVDLRDKEDYEESEENQLDESATDSDYDMEDDKKKSDLTKFSKEYMQNVLDYYDERNEQTGCRKRTFHGVQRRYKRIKNSGYITKFRKYLEENGGTKKQKLDQVDDYVYDRFVHAREQCLPVHDNDLRRWAVKKGADISLQNFVAGHHWLLNFKYRHCLCSCKITKVKNSYVLSRIRESIQNIMQLSYG